MWRRQLLLASGAALLTAACGAGEERPDRDGDEDGHGDGRSGRVPAPDGALGANVNEDPGGLRLAQLRALSAGWLRGFVPVPEADRGPVEQQPSVAALLRAHRHGYGTVLSLKFPYRDQALPRPGTARMAAELARVEKIAHAVLGSVDILVIGNEPFLESRTDERDGPAVNLFYEHVARHLIAYRARRFPERSGKPAGGGADRRTGEGGGARLYLGALNHLDRPGRRTGATRRWLEFARREPEIEGVDIHPHVASLSAAQQYLDYVVPRLRDDQRFLATEFSLVLNWRRHLRDRIPGGFARRYGADPDTRVWQVLKEAVERPFPQEKWDAFLAMSPWFHENRHYLRDQVGRFRATGKLAVATYGVVQAEAMVRDIGPDKQPWLLNSLYANRTVRTPDGGLPGRNRAWCEDFRALQRPRDGRPGG